MANNLFAQRLTQLRTEKGIKREDVAAVLNCSVSAVGNYENGNRAPDFDGLLKLADFFDTTTDYLLGRTSVKTSDKDLQFVCEYTGLSENAVNRFVDDFKSEKRAFAATLEGYSSLDVADRFISEGYFWLMVMQTLNYSVYKYRGDVLALQSAVKELREKANIIYKQTGYKKDNKDAASDIIDCETFSNGYLYSIQKTVADFAEDFYMTCIFGVPEEGESNGNNPETK